MRATDLLAAVLAVVTGVIVVWHRRMWASVPAGDEYLVIARQPRVASLDRSQLFFVPLLLVGLGLWLSGTVKHDRALVFVGLVVLASGALVSLALGLLARADLAAARGRLRFEADALVLEIDGQTRRVALTPGCVRAWTVGNGLSGPVALQLAIGSDPAQRFAVFARPALRHWRLAEGAPWLNQVGGVSPLVRGAAFVERLAPFIVPGT